MVTSWNASPSWRLPVERELPRTAPLSSRTRQRLLQLETSYELLRSFETGSTVNTERLEMRYAEARRYLLHLIDRRQERISSG
jgi:hypothetical protein